MDLYAQKSQWVWMFLDGKEWKMNSQLVDKDTSYHIPFLCSSFTGDDENRSPQPCHRLGRISCMGGSSPRKQKNKKYRVTFEVLFMLSTSLYYVSIKRLYIMMSCKILTPIFKNKLVQNSKWTSPFINY